MRALLSFLLLLASTIAMAQDRLEPTVQPTEDAPLCTKLYYQEIWRLITADNAEWGVVRCPSNMSESSLTYDATASALVYTQIDGILWDNVSSATTRRVEREGIVTIEHLTEHTDYKVPETKRATLPIPDSTAGKLRAIWTAAINSAEENDMAVLDGCSYVFFAEGKKAQAHGFKEDWVRVPRLTRLADALMLATKEGDANALQQLQGEIDELYLLFCSDSN